MKEGDVINGDRPAKRSKTHALNQPSLHFRFLLTHPVPDHDPPRISATARYLLDAWHSTTSALAEGVAFNGMDSHMGEAAVVEGY